MKMPTRIELRSPPIGGHEVLSIGWSDHKQAFLCVNSWEKIGDWEVSFGCHTNFANLACIHQWCCTNSGSSSITSTKDYANLLNTMRLLMTRIALEASLNCPVTVIVFAIVLFQRLLSVTVVSHSSSSGSTSNDSLVVDCSNLHFVVARNRSQ